MRKYAMPNVIYILLIMILAGLSVGSTYAYFSAIDKATSNLKVHNIDVSWRDANANDSKLTTWFDDTKTDANEAMSIAISGDSLRIGHYVEIKAKNIEGKDQSVKLKISNFGSTGAYCRIKITATYTNQEGELVECDEDKQWLQLALGDNNEEDEKTLITESGWFYSDGYYYYGSSIGNFTEIGKNTGVNVADHLYLSSTTGAELYGVSLNIVLTLDAVQSSNKAYESAWGLG